MFDYLWSFAPGRRPPGFQQYVELVRQSPGYRRSRAHIGWKGRLQ